MAQALVDWLVSQEGVTVNPKIKIRLESEDPDQLFLEAQADIDVDEVLFEIPRKLAMDVTTSDFTANFSGNITDMERWQQIILVMIYEFGKGAESPWFKYLQTLPYSIENSLNNWSQEDLGELQGSAIVRKVGKEQTEQAIKQSILPVLQNSPALFGAYGDEVNEDSCLELSHRMGGMMMARAFDLEENTDSGEESEDEEEPIKALIPLADVLAACPKLNNTRLRQGSQELTMLAIKPIMAGEQLYTHYGELPRADILRRYGYVNDEYAPYDVVEISTQRLIDIAAAKLNLGSQEISLRSEGDHRGLQRRMTKLLEKAYAFEDDSVGLDIFEDSYDLKEPLPNQVVALDKAFLYTLWLLVADDDEIEAIKTKSSEPRMSLKVAWILLEVLLDRKKDYATSVEEDQALLQVPNLLEKRRAAIKIRLGEKMILQSILQYLERLDEQAQTV